MATTKRSNKKETATKGGTPTTSVRTGAAAAPENAGASEQQAQTDERLQAQRDAATERARRVAQDTTARAAKAAGASTPDGVFTAVSRNGLFHRRNGIEFGAEPVTVDTSDWTEEQKQRFFHDTLLMIVSGAQLNARGATLAPAAALPHHMAGGSTENATPQMLRNMQNGIATPHPSTGSANPVVGAGRPLGAQQLEQIINEQGDENAGDDGGEA
jgi:hypothetical protein